NFRINIIDTPGHVDFTAEVERSLRVLDGTIALFSAVEGVEPQSETVWQQADRYEVPRLCFVNKMDRVGADYGNVLANISRKLSDKVIPIQLPIGKEAEFRGVINVVDQEAYTWPEDAALGAQFDTVEIPADQLLEAQEARKALIDRIAEYDEHIIELFLEGQEIPSAALKKGIRTGVVERELIPVLCGTAFKNKGVQPLLDAVVDYLPAPVDLPAVVGSDPDREGTELTRAPDYDAPFSALSFKLMTDSYVGNLTFLRVYSGTAHSGQAVLNPRTGRRERLGRLFRMHADKREEVGEARAGEIVAAVGLKNTATGDTLCDMKHPVVLESMTFPDPVISIAIEPATKADDEKLSKALEKLSREDPTFQVRVDPESGQTLISGMGELHLDIIRDRLVREFRVDCTVGR
ncbi:MAG: GTP-binding protein, partial [Myxococcota bacterium]|nr:GTP-binding protein [Myxococcota bacterium]